MSKTLEHAPESAEEEFQSAQSEALKSDLKAMVRMPRTEEVQPSQKLDRLSLRAFPEEAKALERSMADPRVAALLSELKDKSEWSYEHTMGVARGAAALFALNKDLENFTDEDRGLVTKAALLHDIGKVKIDPEILNAERSLSDEERKAMAQHSARTMDLLEKDFTAEPKLKTLAHLHHQFQNKPQYTVEDANYFIDQLAIEDDEQARFKTLLQIIEVADKFNALASDRPYKQGLPPEKVEEIMFNELQPHGVNLKFVRQIIQLHFPNYYENRHGDE